MRDVIRRQQELNYLCRRNTQQAQIGQKGRLEKRTADAKAYSVGGYVWVCQINEVHQGGRFYRLSTGCAAHYENIKPHNASSEDWCIPSDMHDDDYLMVDLACEVNERCISDENEGNEVLNDRDLPLDLELTEPLEVDDETLSYVEEDWNYPEQTEVDEGVKSDFPLTTETRQSKRGKNKKKYNSYGENFVVDRIVLDDVTDSIVGLDEIVVSQDIDLINDTETDWLDDLWEPDLEFEPEVEQMHEQELTNLRVLEWHHDKVRT